MYGRSTQPARQDRPPMHPLVKSAIIAAVASLCTALITTFFSNRISVKDGDEERIVGLRVLQEMYNDLQNKYTASLEQLPVYGLEKREEGYNEAKNYYEPKLTEEYDKGMSLNIDQLVALGLVTRVDPLRPDSLYPVLELGSKGQDVYKLQQHLQEHRYYTGPLDGDFGLGTQSAVSTFQQNNGLVADGIADHTTQEKLYSSPVSSAPPSPKGAQRELTAFDPIRSNYWNANRGTLIDSLGTRYTSTMQYIITKYNGVYYNYGSSRSDDSYASYCEIHINGEYTKLRGKIAAHGEMTQDGSGSIRILVDKGTTGQWEEVYPKGAMSVTRKTDPFLINVDLGEQIKYVRIEGHGDSVLLLDFVFHND